MGEVLIILPRRKSVGAPKALQYKLGAYCNTNWRCMVVLFWEVVVVGVYDILLNWGLLFFLFFDIWAAAEIHYQESCQSRFSGLYLVFEVFQERNVRKCWQLPISFCKRASHFWGFSDKKLGHFWIEKNQPEIDRVSARRKLRSDRGPQPTRVLRWPLPELGWANTSVGEIQPKHRRP